jgi:type IV secretion system protein VirB10
MNQPADSNRPAPDDANTISPLPGEAGIPNVAEPQRGSVSKKGLLAVSLLVVSLVVVAAFTVQRLSASGKKASDGESKRVSDRPTAATAEPRRLELPFISRSVAATASAPTATTPRIPAIVPTADELIEPIGV